MNLPFDCKVIDKESKEVTNPYSGRSCMLTPEAIAVYDTIKGAEVVEDWDIMQKGLAWCADNYAKEYMILLD